MIYIFFFVFSLIIIFLSKFIAPFIKLVDVPNDRKIHRGSIPLVGGPAIILSLIISSYFFNYDDFIMLIIYSSIIIFVFGFLDDIFNLGVAPRLITQFLAVLILIGSGFIITDYGEYQYLNIDLGRASIIFTALAIVGLMNAINFIDGLDGLCSSIFITSLLSLSFLLFLNGASINDYKVLIILMIIVSAFIIMNLNIFYLGKVFLGDSGSLTLGFILSCLLIFYTQFSFFKINPEIIFWCVTLPVYDFLAVTIKRSINMTNPFKPDRTHIHHLLLIRGYKPQSALFILILLSLSLNFLGFGLFYFIGPDLSLFFYIFLFFLYFIINYKKYI